MDSPCRGHIGNLGHGEYFCLSCLRTRQDAIAVKMAEFVRRARFDVSIQNTPDSVFHFYMILYYIYHNEKFECAQFGKNLMQLFHIQADWLTLFVLYLIFILTHFMHIFYSFFYN